MPPSSRASHYEKMKITRRGAGINTRMPELPEVETIKEDLRELVAGSEIGRALDLDGDRRLFLRDETGFTRARLLDADELEDRLSSLGPEPFEEEFDAGYLQRVIGSRRAQIKPLLLDQKVVSGIGNIYADEILYDARLHPRRKANTL